MKTTLLTLCVLLCATAALGQAASGVAILSNQPQMVQFQSNSQHASQQSMAPTQDLLGRFAYVYARGERPLWEVAPVSQAVPLGDVARMLRKEHATAKKADVVWEN